MPILTIMLVNMCSTYAFSVQMVSREAVILHLRQLLESADVESTTEDSLIAKLSKHYMQDLDALLIDIKVRPWFREFLTQHESRVVEHMANSELLTLPAVQRDSAPASYCPCLT